MGATLLAQDGSRIRVARVIEMERPGHPKPAGVAFSPRANSFLVHAFSDFIQITHVGKRAGSARIEATVESPINLTFDSKANRLLIYQPVPKTLIVVDAGPDGTLIPSSLRRINVHHFGLDDAQGMTVDPETGILYVLDAAPPRIVRIEPDFSGGFEGAAISEIDLSPSGLTGLQGIAVDPETDNLNVLSPGDKRLYEISHRGLIVANRDLTAINLTDPHGMVYAPSGDLTDDPAAMNLYLAGDGQIIELAFSQPATMEALVLGSLVQTIDTSLFSPPSPDPAGIAWLDSSESLMMSDSEVEEMPIFDGVNLFEITLAGSQISNLSTTSFSNEPTGVAFNPANKHLFLSDDIVTKVFEMDPGPDNQYDTPDDIITSFGTLDFGSADPEGIAFGEGDLFIVDGLNAEVYRVSPGPDAIFGNGNDVVTHFDTESLEITDPEGITFDSDNGFLYIVGSPRTFLWQTTTDGTLVRIIDISAANARDPAGLAYAPGSLNSTVMNVYITDRGVDNNQDPDENDGKIYEISIPPITPGNTPPSVSAGNDQAIILPAGASLNGTVTDDGVPAPPQVTTVWSVVSGPGIVTFDDPGAVDTTARPSSAGTYVLRLTADDGELIGTDELTLTVTGSLAEFVTDVRVSAGSDDAEERVSGSVNITSGDLELVFDAGGNQTVGMRFNGVDVPRGASIAVAFIQFEVRSENTVATDLTIYGEDVDDASTFIATSNNITSRPPTTAAVPWSPPVWTTRREAGPDQRTSDIASVIQEIVHRPGWSSGNSLVIIVSGTGERTADSFDGDPGGAPLLHVEFSPGIAADKALTGNADEDGSGKVSLGDTLTFTITATNLGDVTLTNVTVDDDLTGTVDAACAANLAPNASCSVDVMYVVQQSDVDAGVINNTGTVDSNQTDPVSTVHREVLGSSFFTVDPCRIIDTRLPDGPLGGPALVTGDDRIFPIADACGIPSTAKAVSVSIAVRGPTAAGNLRLHPGGTPVPPTSSINYSLGQRRSNNAVVPLNDIGELAVFAGGDSGTVHFILDVNGYFH
jgi:uncharacterized repeat protein (TIGR01451 family)